MNESDRLAAELFGSPEPQESTVPLREFARTLDVRGVVGLFLQICDLVDQRHRTFRLARNLEPSSIYVSLETYQVRMPAIDDPKALAGPQAPKVVQTQAAEYLSPEQLESGVVTTASNVYSIGVMLFESLAGRVPRAGQVVSIDGRAMSEPDRTVVPLAAAMEFNTPGTPVEGFERRRLSLRSDLNSIVAKALSLEPALRYASARDLAADLRSYLEARPVSAHRSTWQYRTAKYFQRNGNIVFAASTSALVLSFALGLAIWQTSRLRAQEEWLNRQNEAVQGLPQIMLSDVFEQLSRIPGSQAAQTEVVTQAVAHLDELAHNSDYRRDIRSQLVEAYIRASSIQGDPYRGNLGDYKAAEESARKAMALASSLRSRPGSDMEVDRQEASARRALGVALAGQDRDKEAIKFLGDASSIFEKLAFLDNPSALDAIEAAICNDLLGDVTAKAIQTQRDPAIEEQATGYFQKAAKLHERALQIEPGNKLAMAGIVTEMSKVATFFRQTDPLASIPHFERAIQRLERLPPERRNSIAGLREEAALYGGLGRALEFVGRRNEAGRPLGKALELRRKLALQDVNNPLAKSELQVALHDRATVLMNIGQREEALTLLLEEADLLADLAKNSGSVWNEQLADVLYRCAELQNASGQIEAAAVSGRRALDVIRKIVVKPDLTPAQLSTAIERAIQIQPNRLQDPELALELAERLEKGGASGPEHWYIIGQAYQVNNRNTEARTAMLHALSQINTSRSEKAQLRRQIQESILSLK